MQDISVTNNLKDEAAGIIHSYAAAHSVAAFLLANTVIGDAPVLTILTFSMIDDLGTLFGIKNTPYQILRKFLQLFAAQIGGYLAAKFITWIPWVGNAINASLTFGITESIGWTIFHLYNNGKNINTASTNDINMARKKAEEDSIDYDNHKKKLENLPDEVRSKYESLAKEMTDSNLTEHEKNAIAKKMKEIMMPYINS